MEPHDDTKQRKPADGGTATLTSSKRAAQTVPDELKQGGHTIEEPPVAGAIVDPAEVIPPVVPARRASSRKWALAAVLAVCVVAVVVLVIVYGG